MSMNKKINITGLDFMETREVMITMAKMIDELRGKEFKNLLIGKWHELKFEFKFNVDNSIDIHAASLITKKND